MANRLTTNPIYFDQFNADTDLCAIGNPFIVRKIRLLSAGDGDIFQLEDMNGQVLVDLVQTGAADVVEIDFGDKGFNLGNKGVRIDVTDCANITGTNGTDAVWIYLI